MVGFYHMGIHGSHRNAEHGGRLLVTFSFHFTEEKNLPACRRHPVNGLLYQVSTFAEEKVIFCIRNAHRLSGYPLLSKPLLPRHFPKTTIGRLANR